MQVYDHEVSRLPGLYVPPYRPTMLTPTSTIEDRRFDSARRHFFLFLGLLIFGNYMLRFRRLMLVFVVRSTEGIWGTNVESGGGRGALEESCWFLRGHLSMDTWFCLSIL